MTVKFEIIFVTALPLSQLKEDILQHLSDPSRNLKVFLDSDFRYLSATMYTEPQVTPAAQNARGRWPRFVARRLLCEFGNYLA